MSPEDVPIGPVLVDTDVASWLLTARDEAAPWIDLLRGHQLLLSFVGVGELLALAHVKRWGVPRQSQWETAIRAQFAVVPYSNALAAAWAPMHAKYSGHMQRGGARR